ncbi:MAG: S8 family serine peptidase [Ezakiella sp.]|nr:S8 family serine peptidase [Ezakiella sp.]
MSKKKLLAILLSVFMIIGIIPITTNADSLRETQALKTLTSELDGKLADDEVRTFIVEIFENNQPVQNSSADMTVMAFNRAVDAGNEESLVEKRINDQNEVLADIFGERNIRREADNISYAAMSNASSFKARNNRKPIIKNTDQLKTMPRYKALLNGFALDMTYEQAKQVASLPNVKSVNLAVEYKLPVDTPNMATSKNIIKANVSQTRGYNGKGRVVAILDTGADISHPDFRLSEEGLANAKYNEETINQKIAELHLWGEYKTPKIPYAYNYANRTYDVLDSMDHGQHIAGTIAGNAEDPSNGVVGVVPEAQLLVMRCFPFGEDYTNTAIYAEAIDDAVLLGADSINMSLGSFAGSEDSDKIMTQVVQNANDHGTIVCIAGGNDGYQFSNTKVQPTDILDFAAVGSPSTMKESLAVASYNNTDISYYRGLFEVGGTEYNTNKGIYTKSKPEWELEKGKTYDLVFVGKGNTNQDYEGKDVEGKVVIAERGGLTFGEKSAMARAHGAAACLIGYTINPGQKYDFLYTITVENIAPIVPTFNLSNKDYDAIKKQMENGVNEIKFITSDINQSESPVKNMMSDFNSWGPTPGLGIKPEITAPGGDIFSTANDGGYQSMSGTSMATPHVAAGIAAVRGKLQEMNNLGLKEDQIAPFVKKVLMNNADPAKTLSDTGYFSVRSQGAGVMNLDKATSGKYVTIEDNRSNASSYGEPKVEFKQIDNATLDVNVKLRSYLKENVNYKVSYVLQTDRVENGRIMLDPDEYDPIPLAGGVLEENFALSAGSQKTLEKTISWDDSELASVYPKGYFVDGYLFFTPQGADVPTISIPMLAFKGAWGELSVLEPFVHTYDLEKDRPFWLKGYKTVDKIKNAPVSDLNATMLTSDMIYYDNNENYFGALGRGEWGDFTDNFAISPGVKDKSQDSFKFRGVFLRNWEDFYIEILAADQQTVVKKVENTYRMSGRKTGNTINGVVIKAISEAPWVWDGTDADGNQVPEGTYYVKVHVRPANNPEAPAEEKIVKLYVDNTMPTIDQEPVYDETNKTLTLKAADNLSGIKVVYYAYPTPDGKSNWTGFEERDDQTYVFKNIPDGGIVYVADWAGNLVKYDLNEKGENQLVIKRTTEEGTTDPGTPIVVLDNNGNKMTNLNALNDGKYTIEAYDVPEGYNVDIDPTEVTFGEDGQKTKEVVVKFTKIAKEDLDKYGTAKVTVIDSANLWNGFKIFAVDKSGKKYQLYTSFDWGAETYGAKVPAGDYTIVVLDSSGNKVPFSGRNTMTVPKQDTAWINIRFLDNGQIPLALESHVPELTEKIQDLGETTGGDNKYSFDPSKIFRLIDPATGKDLFADGKTHEAWFYPWDGGFDFWIPADGNYQIELINDNREYFVDPTSVLGNLYHGYKDEKPNWAWIYVYPATNEKANITIKEEYVPGETSTEQIDAQYHLYNRYGEEIPSTTTTTWENIPADLYTLEVVNNNDRLIPERKSYDINALDNLDVEQVVRFKDFVTDPVKRETSLMIGIYGNFDKSIKEFTLWFKNVNTGETDKFTVPVGTKPFETVIPLGSYEISVDLPEDTIISDVFLSSEDYKNVKNKLISLGSKFDATFTTAFNEIEINLAKQVKDTGEIQVEEIGLNGETAVYRLVDSENTVVKVSYNGIFTNVEPGKYTVEVEAPNRYKADPDKFEAEVKTGEISKYSVRFEKDLENATVVKGSVKAVEVDLAGDELGEISGVLYEAVGKDGTVYEIDSVPVDTPVKIVEKAGTLPSVFERKPEGYRTFAEDFNLTYKYTKVDVAPVDPNGDEQYEGYVRVDFDAKHMGALNAPEFKNKQKISYLVKEGYSVEDFAYYMPTVTPDQNFEFIGWNPAFPTDIVVDGSYVATYRYKDFNIPSEPEYTDTKPEKPYKEPTYDLSGNTTTASSVVAPKETNEEQAKDDFGIIEFIENLPVDLTDLPEGEAAEAIRNMVSKGVLKGVGENKFAGELPITRAMVAEVLMRISTDKSIAEANFSDVKDTDWFSNAVKWGVKSGLFKGYEDGTFKPNKNVSRQEFAVIISRFLNAHGIQMDKMMLPEYKDLDSIPAWSKADVLDMAGVGLVLGETDEMYNPLSDYSRVELALTLNRLINWVLSNR